MKKRLLITSIVMMLVVAVALSTATYAWFTSNATVTANTITMTAATNEAPALGISWIDANYLSEIDADAPDGDTFAPAAPVSLVDIAQKTADNSLTLTTTENIVFKTALATPDTSGEMVFLANGATTPVYTWTDGEHTSFFLKNLSPSNSIASIRMTASISGTGSAADLIRIGVFKKNTTSGKFELMTILAKGQSSTYNPVAQNTVMADGTTYYKLYLGKYVPAVQGEDENDEAADWYPNMQAPANTFYTVAATASHANAVYGAIVEGEPVNDMEAYSCTNDLSFIIATNLGAGEKIELMILVWEDAVALGDAEQESVSTIGFNFTV